MADRGSASWAWIGVARCWMLATRTIWGSGSEPTPIEHGLLELPRADPLGRAGDRGLVAARWQHARDRRPPDRVRVGERELGRAQRGQAPGDLGRVGAAEGRDREEGPALVADERDLRK